MIGLGFVWNIINNYTMIGLENTFQHWQGYSPNRIKPTIFIISDTGKVLSTLDMLLNSKVNK